MIFQELAQLIYRFMYTSCEVTAGYKSCTSLNLAFDFNTN